MKQITFQVPFNFAIFNGTVVRTYYQDSEAFAYEIISNGIKTVIPAHWLINN